MTPVLRGLVRYESLLDGTVSLADLDRLNHCLMIQDENIRRYREALKDDAGRH